MLDPSTLRGLERILNVMIGGLTIYMGYRMFLSLPFQVEGEGRFKLPGGFSIVLSRVGPGIFFALFGTLLVGTSFFSPVEVTRPDGFRTAGFGPAAVSEGSDVSPRRPPANDAGTRPERRGEAQRSIALLNQAGEAIGNGFASIEPGEAQDHLQDVRLHIMSSVWGEDWGDFDSFRAWAKFDTAPPDSDPFRRARIFYEHGLGE